MNQVLGDRNRNAILLEKLFQVLGPDPPALSHAHIDIRELPLVHQGIDIGNGTIEVLLSHLFDFE
jgi:hypothetical protein